MSTYLNRFREVDRGKRAYFVCKWELSKQDGESPWSDTERDNSLMGPEGKKGRRRNHGGHRVSQNFVINLVFPPCTPW
jgi:hypothetical protein